MPIYEYRCGGCGQKVELLVRSTAEAPRCPHCASPLTDKLFSVPNLLSGKARIPELTCCGQEERCDEPACAQGAECRRHA
jgi:putative FmdB family regulatory protein